MNVLLRRRKLGKGSCAGIASVSRTGLRTVRSWADTIPMTAEYVFRWGCTASLGLEGLGHQFTVVNTAKAIHWCSDKRASRLAMQEAGVSVPATWGVNADGSVMAGRGDIRVGVPKVVRPVTHAQGRHLYVLDQFSEAIAKCMDIGGGYISAFIPKVAEFRVAVVQNRVAWIAEKTPGNPEQVAWNVAQGGKFTNVKWGEWPVRVALEALKAANVSGCDFCGVDVMVTEDGTPYVLEVNSAPSLTSPYRQQCFAKCFDYIVEHGKATFPDVSGGATTWKDIIHPAVGG